MAGNKQAAQRFDGERFNLRKLNELEVRKQYQLEITNRFAALYNLSDNEDIIRGLGRTLRRTSEPRLNSLGLQILKQHKPWFHEECLGFIDQRKQAKMLWIHDPSQSNVDTLNNVRHDARRHFRNKKKV